MEQTINQYKITQETLIWMEMYDNLNNYWLAMKSSNYKWIELTMQELNLKKDVANTSMNSPCKLSIIGVSTIQLTPLTFSSPHGFLLPKNDHQYVCISFP
jgi:hypothetical protein